MQFRLCHGQVFRPHSFQKVFARTLLLFVISCIVVLAAQPGVAHPSSETHKLQHAVLLWSHALFNRQPDTMEPLLHESFQSTSRSRFATSSEEYLEQVLRNEKSITRLILDFATYEIDGDEATVAPIIMQENAVTSPYAIRLRFIRDKGRWLLAFMENTDDMPMEYVGLLPEQKKLTEIAVSIRDAYTGQPIAARVHAHDADGEYWPPKWRIKNFPVELNESVGRNVMVNGQRFAYVDPDFILPLARGQYVIEVQRGPEYLPYRRELTVDGDAQSIEIRLKRWINMNERGWYSGDTHIHFMTPQNTALEARGEDLDVANILATKWGPLYTNIEHFTGAQSSESTAENIVFVNQEARHDFIGHASLLNLKELVDPIAWGRIDKMIGSAGVWNGYDYPSMAHIADRVHEQDGYIAWAHFPGPMGEVAIDAALNKLDGAEIMVFNDPLAPTWGPLITVPGAAGLWYKLLNCGFRITAVAGSDKMGNTQVIGIPRVYAKIEGSFSYERWLEALKRGRTFVTSGPMIILKVNGHDVGDTLDLKKGEQIEVDVEVYSNEPVDIVDIVVGGAVVEAKKNPSGIKTVKFKTSLAVEEPTWIAARAYSSKRTPYQELVRYKFERLPVTSHTNPVYLNVDKKTPTSAEDAKELAAMVDNAINWAKSSATYQHESQRQEVLEIFERAKAVYVEQIDSGDR